MWKWRYKESNRILSGAALKAHSLQTGVLNATYRFRQVDMFESDEVQTEIFYEQVSELQACRVTEQRILSAGHGKQKGATQRAEACRRHQERGGELVAVGLILAAREFRGLGLPSGRESSPP